MQTSRNTPPSLVVEMLTTVIQAAESSTDFCTSTTGVPATDKLRTHQIFTPPFG